MSYGTLSSNRSRSNGGQARRYLRRAPTSEVDETLFGNRKPKSSEKNGASASNGKDQKKKPERKEVQVVTKDLIRTLRIPGKDRMAETYIIPPPDYKRISSTAHIMTLEERQAQRQAYQKKKEEDMDAAEETKRRLQEADLSVVLHRPLTEMEQEAKDRAEHLKEQSYMLKMEQEEEIKELNQLILSAQCQATCDVQIREKQMMAQEVLDEEMRIHGISETERVKALEAMEHVENLRKQERIKGMQMITNQIQQRMEEQLLLNEIREQEKQQLREKQERMIQEDLEAVQRKRDEQQRLREEVMRINAEAVKCKEERREKERQADLRDMEYIRKKLEREADYEAEQEQIKKDKELEIARLRAKQERAKDYQAEQDELRARRNQQAADREWRRKEMELATKRAQEEEMLRAHRLQQVEHKEQLLSLKINEEKAEFEALLKLQKESRAKKLEEERLHREQALRHTESLRQQVKERELAAAAKRREEMMEAEHMRNEARQRLQRLSDYKEKKMMALRAAGLPDKYCTKVQRKTRDSSR